MMSMVKQNDTFNMNYLNVNLNESTSLYKSTHNLSHDFSALKSFNSSTSGEDASLRVSINNSFLSSSLATPNKTFSNENSYLKLSRITNGSQKETLAYASSIKHEIRVTSPDDDNDDVYDNNNHHNNNSSNNDDNDEYNKNYVQKKKRNYYDKNADSAEEEYFGTIDNYNSYNENENTIQVSTKLVNDGCNYINTSNLRRTMPSKLNVLRHQRERMRKLENLLTKNSVLTPIAVIFSVTIAIILFISIFTDYYEYIYYDFSKLHDLVVNENNLTLNLIEKKILNNHNLTLFKRKLKDIYVYNSNNSSNNNTFLSTSSNNYTYTNETNKDKYIKLTTTTTVLDNEHDILSVINSLITLTTLYSTRNTAASISTQLDTSNNSSIRSNIKTTTTSSTTTTIKTTKTINNSTTTVPINDILFNYAAYQFKHFNSDIDFSKLKSILSDNQSYIFYKLTSSQQINNFYNHNNISDKKNTWTTPIIATLTSRSNDYINNNNNNNSVNNATHDFVILSRIKINLFNNVNTKHFYLYKTYSGLWQTCNFLSEKSRNILNVTKCLAFYTDLIEIEEDTQIPYLLGQRLLRLQNTAACCSIVCLILIVWSIITGFLSMLRKYVPLTMATGFLNILSLTFLIFLLAIMHTKIHEESKTSSCYDIKILLNLICSIRTIKIGSSLAITWVALLLSFISSILWLYLTKIQKVLVHMHGHLN